MHARRGRSSRADGVRCSFLLFAASPSLLIFCLLPPLVLLFASIGLVLTTVKKDLLDSVLAHTASRGADARKPDVKILSSGARLGTADTVFEQSLRALRGVPVRRLRAPRPDDRRKQMFPGLSVSFEDEDAVGDDGPYLQLFSTISDEIADVEVRRRSLHRSLLSPLRSSHILSSVFLSLSLCPSFSRRASSASAYLP